MNSTPDTNQFTESITAPSATDGTAPLSLLAAHEEALNSYLQSRLRIEFNYFGNEVAANEPPKGIAQVFRRNDLDEPVLSCEPVRYSAIAAIRILISGTEHAAVRRLILDWSEFLKTEMDRLSLHGLTGEYRGHYLREAFEGIRQASAETLPSESADQRQDLDAGLIRGAVQAQYEFDVVPSGAVY